MDFRNLCRIIILAVSGLALAGCPGSGGSGVVSVSNAPSTENPVGISISLRKINTYTLEQLDAAHRIDSTSAIHTKDLTISITGECSFGVAKVIAFVNTAQVAEGADCSSMSEFTWTKTFPGSNPETGTLYAVELKPATSAGTVFSNLTPSQMIATEFVVDDNAPDPITSVTVAGATLDGSVWYMPSTGSIANPTASGTAPSDAYETLIDNHPSVTVTTASGSISYSDSLAAGVSRTYNLIVYDRAGNASTTTTVIIDNPLDVGTKLATFSGLQIQTSGGFVFRGGMGPGDGHKNTSSGSTTYHYEGGLEFR
jgi:hypothetical protein